MRKTSDRLTRKGRFGTTFRLKAKRDENERKTRVDSYRYVLKDCAQISHSLFSDPGTMNIHGCQTLNERWFVHAICGEKFNGHDSFPTLERGSEHRYYRWNCTLSSAKSMSKRTNEERALSRAKDGLLPDWLLVLRWDIEFLSCQSDCIGDPTTVSSVRKDFIQLGLIFDGETNLILQ